MTTNPEPVKPRIASIDIFRGLTMLIMIFVNELSGVHGLPRWTYHAHAAEDRMTYVDMVFPFFLFIVGMSMPLAIAQRLRREPSQWLLWRHVAFRGLGLILLGLILANADHADRARMLLNQNAWALTGILGGILLWLAPPRNTQRPRLYNTLHALGFLLLILAYALFRRTAPGGQAAWIDGSYPEILGLIGYTYLAAAVCYIPTRRWLWSPIAWCVIFLTYCALTTRHLLHFPPPHTPIYLWPLYNGAMVLIVMAGIVVSNIFFSAHRWTELRSRIQLALAFAAVTLAGAFLLAPLGISKIRATPTWCLGSIAAATLAFTLLYWVCDIRGAQRWATLVRPAGENTLLTYLLPDLYYFLSALVGFVYLDSHLNHGAVGVLRTICFTLLMLAFSTLLTRAGIFLKL